MSTIIIISLFVIAVSFAFMIGVGVQYGYIFEQNSYIKHLEKKVQKGETDLHFAQQEVLILKDLLKKMELQAYVSDEISDIKFVTKDDVQKRLTYIHDKLQKAGLSSFFFAAETEIGEIKNFPLVKNVAYTKEGYEYEYFQVLDAMILETINDPKPNVFHDSILKLCEFDIRINIFHL